MFAMVMMSDVCDSFESNESSWRETAGSHSTYGYRRLTFSIPDDSFLAIVLCRRFWSLRSTIAWRNNNNTTTMGDFEGKARELIPAQVRMISGCQDSQTSADVSNVNQFELPDPAGENRHLLGESCAVLFA